MTTQFPIIEIPLNAPEDDEEMGTKEKFWFTHPQFGRCLYKKARQNTGEDWSEKIAAELCHLLGIPHASYELAIFNGDRGIISPSFFPTKQNITEFDRLTPGNEILQEKVSGYPDSNEDLSQHTINNVFNAISSSQVNLPFNWTPPEGITTTPETFVSYLLLDAWIGNTDRHHENWAFMSLNGEIYLAPTYDHASCLGRELLDGKKSTKLQQNKSVTGYAQKCSSALYAEVRAKKPLKTFDAFCESQNLYPDAAKIWLTNLDKISSNDTVELFQRIPSDLISQTSIDFGQDILGFNRDRLLKLLNT
ncbi:HipA domain-containing protein [Calothrix rhizosoleniae]|uniref:HipA domain-containing protein n=1 Tax=Calothrix rhizosoleniae TaxID=888997 RepID=UPI000B4A0126|nr:HipA domain-containing protein [Calothrix rhizosoleniae]